MFFSFIPLQSNNISYYLYTFWGISGLKRDFIHKLNCVYTAFPPGSLSESGLDLSSSFLMFIFWIAIIQVSFSRFILISQTLMETHLFSISLTIIQSTSSNLKFLFYVFPRTAVIFTFWRKEREMSRVRLNAPRR